MNTKAKTKTTTTRRKPPEPATVTTLITPTPPPQEAESFEISLSIRQRYKLRVSLADSTEKLRFFCDEARELAKDPLEDRDESIRMFLGRVRAELIRRYNLEVAS